ncbi:hypothetical protein B0T19DRAFT_411025 [Cercophora scortea]|uniref:Uncharacterized protein n=1 Tax=Cercophora scortea TaxID=314031 RepID=A0AAE0J4S5_9PEZI|nr:hypothetical protein B0T19DRAFT_411025 [Cercophora scortea]
MNSWKFWAAFSYAVQRLSDCPLLLLFLTSGNRLVLQFVPHATTHQDRVFSPRHKNALGRCAVQNIIVGTNYHIHKHLNSFGCRANV